MSLHSQRRCCATQRPDADSGRAWYEQRCPRSRHEHTTSSGGLEGSCSVRLINLENVFPSARTTEFENSRSLLRGVASMRVVDPCRPDACTSMGKHEGMWHEMLQEKCGYYYRSEV